MSSPVPVEQTIETILDDIAPIVPLLAQKIPNGVRASLYAGLPVAGALFDTFAPRFGVSGTAVAIVDLVDAFLLGVVALGNTPRPAKKAKGA